MYGLLVKDRKQQEKAKRTIQKFTRNARVLEGRSVMFLYSGWPVNRKVCMKCDKQLLCPLGLKKCPVDRVIEEALIGLRALEYSHVRARIVFPAP